jgi:4-amino-4-deoxy-L-arabinose transferase-like glycosyltransferase
MGGILLLYFVTRLYNILTLPIFTDEAIYVRWSQIAAGDASFRFISLTDGKQPMLVWIAMLFLKFVHDPLLAGRLVSVLAGFFSLVGIFFLTKELFQKKAIAIIACLLYVLFPFSLVYDRLALYDSLVAAFIIWSLYFEILLVKRRRLDLAMILGIVIGFGMLTKTSNNFALILLPFSLLLFTFRSKKDRLRELAEWGLYAGVAFVIANAIYAILRLSPYYYVIEEKNYVFIYPFKEWITHPFTYFVGNFTGMSSWLLSYATAPFLILVIASFLVGRKYYKEKLLLLVWFAVPFIALAFFGKVIYARYILFMSMPLLVLAAYSLYNMIIFTKKIWIQSLIVLVFTSMFIVTDYFIITDFAKASIPNADKEQFFTGWASGQGVRETVAYLEEQAKHGKIYVATQGTFGLMPYALEIYLKDNPNIKIVGYWPIDPMPPKDLVETAQKTTTYTVFYQPCFSCESTGLKPLAWPGHPVMQIMKPDGGSYTLYKY